VAGDLPIADVLSKLMISAHTLSDTMISSMMTSPIGERFERLSLCKTSHFEGAKNLLRRIRSPTSSILDHRKISEVR
jgi:hypothetical protein